MHAHPIIAAIAFALGWLPFIIVGLWLVLVVLKRPILSAARAYYAWQARRRAERNIYVLLSESAKRGQAPTPDELRAAGIGHMLRR